MTDDFDVRDHWEKYWGNLTPFHRDALRLELLGWDLAAGSVTLRLPYREMFDNSPDPEVAVIHGGVLASFVDATTGFVLAMVSRGQGGPTVDLRLDCLAPARRTALVGEARSIKCGRKIGVADVSITDESGRLVAVGRQTCYMGG
jgi:uncharacterized protein (TIGR00369 family)